MYNSKETSEKLNISIYTLKVWYLWENKLLKDGSITERFLPEPIRLVHKKGSPKMWDDEMIAQLKEFKKNMVVGRNGVYGKYSNPYHTQTKKYKKKMEEKPNESSN